MEQENLTVLFQDDFLVAVHKPAGLLVHKTDLAKDSSANAMEQLRDQLGQWVYPVHRLDRPTSGVLLFALSPEVAKICQQLFVENQIQKKYLAMVRGFLSGSGTIDYPLKPLWDKKADFIAQQGRQAKEAITHYRCLQTVEIPVPMGKHATSRYSLLEVMPKTGRQRQIRRHMKHIFHPIIGDTAHGDGKHNQLFRERFSCHRLMLHAQELQFLHPVTKVETVISTEPPASFSEVIEQLPIMQG